MQTDLQITLMDCSSASLSNQKTLILLFLLEVQNLKLSLLLLKLVMNWPRKKYIFGFRVLMRNLMNIFIGGIKPFVIFLNFRKKLSGNQNMFFMEKPLTKIVTYILVSVMGYFVHLNFVSYFSYIRWKDSRCFDKIGFKTKIDL